MKKHPTPYPFFLFRMGVTLNVYGSSTLLHHQFPGSVQRGLLDRTKQLFQTEPEKEAWIKQVYEHWKYNEIFA